jgi:hypothetical protein
MEPLTQFARWRYPCLASATGSASLAVRRIPASSDEGRTALASVMDMVHVLMICPWDSIGDSPEGLEGFSVARVAGRPRASVGASYGVLWV